MRRFRPILTILLVLVPRWSEAIAMSGEHTDFVICHVPETLVTELGVKVEPLRHGQDLNVSCRPGFKPRHVQQIWCVYGQLSGLQTCEEDLDACGPPKFPFATALLADNNMRLVETFNNSSIYEPGTVMIADCRVGYWPENVFPSICNRSYWYPECFEKEKICTGQRSLPGENQSSIDVLPRQTIFDGLQNMYYVCLDGQLKDARDSCIWSEEDEGWLFFNSAVNGWRYIEPMAFAALPGQIVHMKRDRRKTEYISLKCLPDNELTEVCVWKNTDWVGRNYTFTSAQESKQNVALYQFAANPFQVIDFLSEDDKLLGETFVCINGQLHQACVWKNQDLVGKKYIIMSHQELEMTVRLNEFAATEFQVIDFLSDDDYRLGKTQLCLSFKLFASDNICVWDGEFSGWFFNEVFNRWLLVKTSMFAQMSGAFINFKRGKHDKKYQTLVCIEGDLYPISEETRCSLNGRPNDQWWHYDLVQNQWLKIATKMVSVGQHSQYYQLIKDGSEFGSNFLCCYGLLEILVQNTFDLNPDRCSRKLPKGPTATPRE